MRVPSRRMFLPALVLLVVACDRAVPPPLVAPEPPAAPDIALITRAADLPRSFVAEVDKVVDGDTIWVRVGERRWKIRYLGIDTPESFRSPRKGVEFYGAEATRRNRELVGGRTVRLVFDGRRKDRYGRLLAHVWVEDLLVNRMLVAEGFARVYRKAPKIRRFAELLELERKAKTRQIGMWNATRRLSWEDRGGR